MHMLYTSIYFSLLKTLQTFFLEFLKNIESLFKCVSVQSMSERLTNHTLFRDVGEEQQEDMMDGIEKHLMTSIFSM